MSKTDEITVSKLIEDNLDIKFQNKQYNLDNWGNVDNWCVGGTFFALNNKGEKIELSTQGIYNEARKLGNMPEALPYKGF
jgi:hypothetical protein